MTRTQQILAQLVAFPTVCGDSNLHLIDWVQNLLSDAGFEVTRIWSPDRQRAGLFAQIGPRVAGGICLSAHSDVVPVEGQDWSRSAFELTQSGDRVFGRGVTDMKGFLASALALAQRAADMPLRAPLSLSISYDEEIGCVGIQHMMPTLEALIGAPRAVIVGEPTSMQVAIGHKGKTALRVTCHGQAGHSALAPDFTNAIHVAADFVQQIRGLQDRLAAGPSDADYSVPYSTVHIGQITGGRALNIVPDQAQMLMEFRHLVDIPASQIVQQIGEIAEQVSRAYPAVQPISVEPINAYPGLNTDTHSATVDWARRMAGGTSVIKVPFGTEAGFFAGLGLNAVVIGPGDMATDGHKPDEGLCKSQLHACDAMMDRIAVELMA